MTNAPITSTPFKLCAASLAVAALLAACGESGSTPTSETDGGNGAGATTGANAATGGQNGNGGNDEGGNPTAASLFDETPACPEGTGSFSVLNVEGKLGEFTVAYTGQSGASSLAPGSFSTTRFDDTATAYSPIDLTWVDDPTLAPGEVHTLTGDRLAIPDEFTGGAGFYCVVAGEIGSVPMDRKPATGATIHFRITKVRKRTDKAAGPYCVGPEIAADLRGCMFRTNDYLP